MKKKLTLFIAFISLFCMLALTGCSEAKITADQATSDKYIELTDQAFQDLFAITDNSAIEDKLSYYKEIENETYLNLYQAWRNTAPDLGAYKSIKSQEVYESAESGKFVKSYTCEITYEFEKHDLTTKVSYNNDDEVVSMSMEASYSFAEKMQKALLNTLIGMGTVFMILILISLVIAAFGLVGQFSAKSAAKKAAKKAAQAPQNTVTATVPEATVEEAVAGDDDEIIAVISAAIAAYEAESGESSDGLVVRSIRRVNSKWRNA